LDALLLLLLLLLLPMLVLVLDMATVSATDAQNSQTCNTHWPGRKATNNTGQQARSTANMQLQMQSSCGCQQRKRCATAAAEDAKGSRLGPSPHQALSGPCAAVLPTGSLMLLLPLQMT